MRAAPKGRWYMGCYLEPTQPGSCFRWWTWCEGGKAAETLADLKALVRHTLKK